MNTGSKKGTNVEELFLKESSRDIVSTNDWLYFMKSGEGFAPSRIKQNGDGIERLGNWDY